VDKEITNNILMFLMLFKGCEETGSATNNLTVVVRCKQKLMEQCNKCRKQFLEFQISHLLIQTHN
jgi:translation initiation factor 2 beta subunit (eIF-2beta)/eIF-5